MLLKAHIFVYTRRVAFVRPQLSKQNLTQTYRFIWHFWLSKNWCVL